MSMASSAANTPISPHDIIFSCSICQATINEIYASPEGNRGFHSDRNGGDQELTVTKLWLTECSHLTCSLHLAGGGIPFHPEGKKPSAPCPLCVAERGDRSSKLLFGIVGTGTGEHDQDVPAEYFQMPPTKLGGRSPSSCAMRFQYLSLLRFGITMHMKYTDAKRALTDAERKGNVFKKATQEHKDEVVRLQGRLDILEALEGEYKSWKSREPEVRHYLRNFAAIARENDLLKKQLLQFGFEIPRTEWSMKAKNSQSKREDRSQKTMAAAQHQSMDQSRAGAKHRTSSSGRKRTHEQYVEGDAEPLPQSHNYPPQEFCKIIPSSYETYRRVEDRKEHIDSRSVAHSPSRKYQTDYNTQQRAEMESQNYAGSDWQPAPPHIRPQREAPPSRRAAYVMSGAVSTVHPRERSLLRVDLKNHNVSHLSSAPCRKDLALPSRNSTFLQQSKRVQDNANTAQDSIDDIYVQPEHYLSDSRFFSKTSARSDLHQQQGPRPPPSPLAYSVKSAIHGPLDKYRAPTIAIASPFFTRYNGMRDDMATPRRFQSREVLPEALLSGMNYPVKPSPSPIREMGRSLNSLSFINSPYTSANRRILNANVDPQPSIRGGRMRPLAQIQTHVQSQYINRPDSISNSEHVIARAQPQHDPFRHHVSNFTRVQQSYSNPLRRIFTRDDDLRLLNTIRGAKSSVTIESDMLPFSRIGTGGAAETLLSAGGRKSIRR